MTGFGLYETLRIFLPGAVAAVVLNLILRLATGSGVMYAGGPAAPLIDALTGFSFVFVALAFGFLIYVTDLPVRTRLHAEGDPKNGYEMPAATLQRILRSASGSQKQLLIDRDRSIYFLLTDTHLPAELHRRVYFFGSMFKLYFDVRFLMMLALAFGPAVGFAISHGNPAPFTINWSYMPSVSVCLFFVLIAGVLAERNHAKASIARHGATPYWKELGDAVKGTMLGALVISAAQLIGWFLVAQPSWGLSALGLLLCAISMILWAFFEMGPPSGNFNTNTIAKSTIRTPVLRVLKCKDSERPQFYPAQRMLIDFALVAPALGGAASLAVLQDRSPWTVLFWGAFAGIATLILTVRKHEVQLLRSFRDQSTWLELNRRAIVGLVEEPDDGSWVLSQDG
ncbi:hypothetical protein [Rhodococcus ruber]|uniref:hypothetical protein n=1 Tax=Rhodococcus ruber TaxID=1830 RepID=UPI000A8B42CB|nr:hypothetical protein [Rhodococcus ruber]